MKRIKQNKRTKTKQANVYHSDNNKNSVSAMTPTIMQCEKNKKQH
jgi:hypothetical protein